MPFLRAAGVATVLALATPASAQTPRLHTVTQILVAGIPADSAAGVIVTPASGQRESGLHRGEAIADGTRIDVPANVVVVIASTGGKSTATLEPGASVTFVSTGSGELVSDNGGKTLFSVVPKSLDFFRVQSGEALSASVHGTEFSVDAGADVVSYTCTVGEVNIDKTGYLVVGAHVAQVTLTDVISAASNPQATYHPSPTWKLAKFSNYAEARVFFEARLAAAQTSGNVNAIRQATGNLGVIEDFQGDYADALASYQQEIAIAREAGDIVGQASGTLGVAGIAYQKREFADAETSYRQALALDDAAGDEVAAAGVLWRLAENELSEGLIAQALTSDQQSIALEQGLDDKRDLGWAQLVLGRIRERQGDDTAALGSFQDALAQFQSQKNRHGEADALRELGDAQALLKDYTVALDSRQAALAIYQELGEPRDVALTDEKIGTTQKDLGHTAEALAAYQQALALYQQLGLSANAAIVSDKIIRLKTATRQ